MKHLVLSIIFLASAASKTFAVAAASPQYADVLAAYNATAAGGTVTVPAGTATWGPTQWLDINKSITIQGAGVGVTTIIGGYQAANFGNRNYLFQVRSSSGVRISGFTMNLNGRGGGVNFTNSNSQNRVDHCFITNCGHMSSDPTFGSAGYGVQFQGYKVYGVIDHCTFTNNSSHIDILGANYYSWQDPQGMGTDQGVFVEDCTLNAVLIPAPISRQDAPFYNSHGGRVTVRKCVVNTTDPNAGSFWDTHGNNSWPIDGANASSMLRGGVYTVIEDNQLNLGAPNLGGKMFYIRGGMFIANGNTVTTTSGGYLWVVTEEEAWNPADNSVGPGCRPNWPAADQVYNAWVWNNTHTLNGAPQNGNNFLWQGSVCSGNNYVVTVLQKNRDIFDAQVPPAYNATANVHPAGPAWGYTRFQYPHPLVTGGGPGPSPTPGDTTLPTLTSAVINNLGTTLTLTFSEACNLTISGGFTMNLTGGAITPSNLTGTGSSIWIFNTLSRVANAGQTGTVVYTQPGNGIEDLAGNDLATVTIPITNNSTEGSVATPVITLPAGPYYGPQTTTVTCATVGASIYYTLDGSVPDSGDTLYTGPITIPQGATTTVRAIAVKSGSNDSPLAQSTYEVDRWASTGAAFKSVELVPPVTTSFSVDVTPSVQNSYTVVMLGEEVFDDSTDMRAAVWFTDTGTIVARNGAAYASLTPMTYLAANTYKVVFTPNVTTDKYDVTVNGVLLGDDYDFRSPATQLDYLGLYTANGTTITTVSSPTTVTPVGTVNATSLTIGP